MANDSDRTREDQLGEVDQLRARLAEAERLAIAAQESGDSSAWFRDILDHADVSIFLKDLEGRYLLANAIFLEKTGLSPEDLLGRTDDELFDSERAAQWMANDQMAIEKRQPMDFEEITEESDGRHIYLATKFPLLDADGNPNAICGIATDITQRRLAEERFRAVIRSCPMGVLLYHLEGDERLILVDSNPAADLMTGADVSSLHGKTIEEAFPPLAQTEVPERYRRAARLGESWHSEEIRYQDETIGGAFEVFAFQTAPDAMAVMFAEITERKRAQENLLATQFAIDHSPDAVFWCNREARLAYVNEAACRRLGYTREELLGMGIGDVDPSFKRERWIQLIQELQESDSKVLQTRQRTKSGATIPVEVSMSHFSYGGDEFICCFARDISERLAAEEQRRNMEAQFQQTQKLESLGVLAGGIAHDFNNLLMGILGNANLAQEDLPPGSPAQESLDQIEKSSQRAAELCRQMLAYSGKGRFDNRIIDLSELVEEILHMLRVSISKKAVLRLDLARDLPPIEADPSQIRQVVMNLITNASEALEERSGVIAISTGTVDCAPDRPGGQQADEALSERTHVFIEVKDTGCGMDAETRAKIFDPFFTTKFTGRGLGLAAVLGIVRGHQGMIEVQSDPGQGSCVRVLLPAGEGRAEELASVSGDESPWRGHGLILVVDDEATVRTLARRILERAGFEVILAQDGQQAVNVFRDRWEEIRCVILDMTMPRMDGEEAFHELQSIQPDVQVVLSSGHSEQEATARFQSSAPALFIQKPYCPSDLLAKVRSALGE